MPSRPQLIRVFVSSTHLDLAERRRLVIEAIQSFAEMKCDFMERFEASTNPPKEESLRRAREADLVVLILAHRYGWIPDGETRSITELEHAAAKAAGIPRLAFVIDERRAPPPSDTDIDPERAHKLEEFKRSIDGSPGLFATDAELVQQVQVAVRQWRERHGLSTTASPTPAPEPRADELSRYREALLAEHRWIQPIGFPTSFRVPIQLDELFVPLRARARAMAAPNSAETKDEELDERREGEFELAFARSTTGDELTAPLALAFAERHGLRALAVLGEPGSGKTTLLRRIVNGVLGSGPELVGLQAVDVDAAERVLPVFVPLRRLRREHCASGLVDAIAHCLPERAQLEGDFARWLVEERGHLLVLLDGLDEVGEDLRDEVARRISDAIRASATSRFVVTSRFAGYSKAIEAALARDVLALEVKPLNDGLVTRFVRNWYAIIERAADPSGAAARAAERANDLLAQLHQPAFSAARVLAMTSNPLLLTVICLVHRDRGSSLPKDRLRLYAEATEVLLEMWRRDEKKLPLHFTAEQATHVLQPVAHFLHSTEGRTDTPESELTPVIERALADISWSGTATEFLHAIRDESGLLAGLGGDRYGFLHLGFQEYFAARYVQQRFAALAFDERDQADALLTQLAERFGIDWWQEVFLIALAMPEQPRLFTPLLERVVASPRFAELPSRFLDDCLREAKEPRERQARPFTAFLASALRRSSGGDERHLSLVTQIALRLDPDFVLSRAEEIVTLLDDTTVQLVLGLVRERKPELHTRVALRVYASAIGVAWTAPPIVVTQWTRVADLIDMAQIPAGTFRMGSTRYPDEQPIHEVMIRTPFWFARTPITNEQYRRFVEATSHAAPESWRERRFNAPDQPVVNVSFEDAQKFCAWLGKRTGQDIRLPSEAQWEYACRAGTTTEYSFGDDGAQLAENAWFHANSDGSTRPVALKPANPFGLFDMHGNVWEWCADARHESYKGAPADGASRMSGFSLTRLVRSGTPDRVVRGGSWFSGAARCRSAYRSWWSRGERSDSLGFRPAMFVTE